MIIRAVTIEGIKSYYKRQKFTFEEGLNVILGPNGVGKTTILEAIGYGIFDLKPYKLEDFISKGKKSGEVEIEFYLEKDERIYSIYRNTNNIYYIFDPQTKFKLTEKKEDTQKWIKQNIFSGEITNISEIFKNVIGVSQGSFAETFKLPPKERKAVFDKILEVEEYTIAFKNLLEPLKTVKDKISQFEYSITEQEVTLKTFNIWPEKKERALKEKEEIEKVLIEFKDLINELKKEVEILSEEKTKIDLINSKKTLLEEEIKREEEKKQDLLKNFHSSYLAKKTVLENIEGFNKFKRIEEDLVKLNNEISKKEAKSNEISKLKESVSNFSGKKELLEIEESKKRDVFKNLIKKWIEETESVEELNILILNLKIKQEAKLKDEEDNLKKLVDLKAKKEAEFQLINEKVRTLEGYIKEQKKVSDRINELRQLEIFLKEKEQIETLINEEKSDFIEKNSRMKQFLEFLNLTQDGLCPFLKEKCLNLKEGNLNIFLKNSCLKLDEELKESKAELMNQENHLKNILDKLKGYEEIASFEAKKAVLEREIEKLKYELETKEDVIKSLEDIKEKIEKLSEVMNKEQQNLTELNSALEKLKEAENYREEIKKIEISLEELKEKIRLKETEIIDLNDLKKHKQGLEDEKNELKEKRDLYIENIQNSIRYEEIKKSLYNSLLDLHNKILTKKSLEKDFFALIASYSEEKHKAKIAEISNLEKIEAKKEADLQAAKKELEEAEKFIALFKEKENEIKNLKIKKDEYKKAQDVLDLSRKIMQQVPPYIIEMITDMATRSASFIFKEILGNYTVDLIWEKEDYELKIEENGIKRPFLTLSGGEQIVAAISLRLALQKLFSDVGIIFFDEPTVNMDDERKQNLADKLKNIEGITQIFVITHDNSFEEFTQNVLRLE